MLSILKRSLFKGANFISCDQPSITTQNLSKYFTSLSAEPSVILNKYTPHISQILLNEPKTRNAVSHNIVYELNTILKQLSKDPQLRALILRSAHPGMFCAGANLKERLAMKSESQVISFLEKMRLVGQSLFAIEVPTIAAIDGSALGGGLQLALTCDLRVATSRALLGLPQTGLAIIPGLFGTQLLSYTIGQAKAKEMIFTGKLLNGIEALELGLVNQVIVVGEGGQKRVSVDGDQYSRQLIQWARDTAQKISQNTPIGEKMSKIAINKGFLKNFSKGADIQWECYNMLLKTEDRIEGLKAFSQKRKPVYKGR